MTNVPISDEPHWIFLKITSHLSQLVDQTVSDRATFFAVVFDIWQEFCEAWITILTGVPRGHLEDDVWEMRFLKKLLVRERCFRENVEPRREKVLKNEDGLNSWTRSIDRSIRRAVDTKLSHVSITRTRRHHAMRLASSRHQ